MDPEKLREMFESLGISGEGSLPRPEDMPKQFREAYKAFFESSDAKPEPSAETPGDESAEGTTGVRVEVEYLLFPGLRFDLSDADKEFFKKARDVCIAGVASRSVDAEEARTRLSGLHMKDCVRCGTAGSMLGQMVPGVAIDAWMATTPTAVACYDNRDAIDRVDGDTVHLKEGVAASRELLAWDVDIDVRPVAVCKVCAAHTCRVHNARSVASLIETGVVPGSFRAGAEPRGAYPASCPKIEISDEAVLVHTTWNNMGLFAKRLAEFIASRLEWSALLPGPIVDPKAPLGAMRRDLAAMLSPDTREGEFAAFYNVLYRPSPAMLAKGSLPKCCNASCRRDIVGEAEHYYLSPAMLPYSPRHASPQLRMTLTTLRFCTAACKKTFAESLPASNRRILTEKGRFCAALGRVHAIIGASPRVAHFAVPVAPICALCPRGERVRVPEYDFGGLNENWCELCHVVPICTKHIGDARRHPRCSPYPSHFVLSMNAAT